MWSQIDAADRRRAFGYMDLNEFNTVHKVYSRDEKYGLFGTILFIYVVLVVALVER